MTEVEKDVTDIAEEEWRKPSVFGAFDDWVMCSGAFYRARHYYIHGDIKDCTPEWEELKYRFWIQSKSLPVAKVLYEARVKEQEESKPNTMGVIWAPRVKPPDGWNNPGVEVREEPLSVEEWSKKKEEDSEKPSSVQDSGTMFEQNTLYEDGDQGRRDSTYDPTKETQQNKTSRSWWLW
eukprot:m.345850 g.345850  ORF g.345850 m.345850 type:complete len:179 (+) comp27453_c0_seq1:273-809(+)